MVSCDESSSHASNSGTMFSAVGYEPVARVEFFGKSNCSLEKLLLDAEYDYSDAVIVVDGVSVGVHRCILALRSQFFHELFKREKDRSMQEGKPKYSLSELVKYSLSELVKYSLSEMVPYVEIGYEPFMVILNYLYTGGLKPSPPEVATCVDDSCAHDACAPAINHAVELMYLSSAFQMKELVAILQCRLLNFVDKAFVEDVIPIIRVAFHCQLNQLQSHCVQRIALSDLDNLILEKELPPEVFDEVKSFGDHSQQELDYIFKVRRVRRIHKALDSDDVELLKLLLNESDTTLDDAHALHYAVAYCNPKVVREVLSLGNANLNLRNSRGYTVLHVAARRKDPIVIVDLLSKGARVSDTTVDGQTAITICRRLTQPKDYNESTTQGQETNTDRLCIDVLEREMLRNPLAGNISVSSMMVADDWLTRLLLFENRVILAQVLFPTEARLAMQVACADSTSEFCGLQASKSSFANLREVDLNETPSEQVNRLQMRLQALQKTVDTGRRFFPQCSEVLDRFMEDNMQDNLVFGNCDPEEERIKRMKLMKFQEEIVKAPGADKAENIRTDPSFSSPSETDSVLLERARKLLRGNTERRKMQHRRLEKAMLTFDIDKAGANWTSSSTSSSCAISPYCGV